MRKKVGDALLQLGITPDLKGFNYIIDMVEMIDKEGNLKMMYFYEMVAKKNNSTASRVERAVRHCVSKADRECDTFKRVFDGVKDINNSAFLYTLHYRLKEG